MQAGPHRLVAAGLQSGAAEVWVRETSEVVQDAFRQLQAQAGHDFRASADMHPGVARDAAVHQAQKAGVTRVQQGQLGVVHAPAAFALQAAQRGLVGQPGVGPGCCGPTGCRGRCSCRAGLKRRWPLHLDDVQPLEEHEPVQKLFQTHLTRGPQAMAAPGGGHRSQEETWMHKIPCAAATSRPSSVVSQPR